MPVMEEVVINLDVPTAACDDDDLPYHDDRVKTTGTVKRQLRDLPPAHYLFKIENFSLLSDANVDNYESSEFEVAGYKWRLSLYPEGNTEGHISLCLVLSESNSLPLHQEVNVSFKLFLYNQLQDKYLTVQDVKDRVWRFRGMVTEWGFDEFLPLDVFHDASNGYLVNDCCIFGAEVFVLDRTSKGECASIIKKLGNSTFTWYIKNYGKQNGEFYRSPDFVIGGFKWFLRLYPNGYEKEKGKSLSMSLILLDSEALNPGEKLQVKFIMHIRNRTEGTEDHELLVDIIQYTATSVIAGYSDLMPLSYLKEPSQGYVNPDG